MWIWTTSRRVKSSKPRLYLTELEYKLIQDLQPRHLNVRSILPAIP
jgi:hypothetical protein